MLKELFNLAGRTALITGGSKGIGKAVARGLAEAGANVAISARHEDELKKAQTEIGGNLNVKVAYFVADMNDGSERGIPPGTYKVRLNREGTSVKTKRSARNAAAAPASCAAMNHGT